MSVRKAVVTTVAVAVVLLTGCVTQQGGVPVEQPPQPVPSDVAVTSDAEPATEAPGRDIEKPPPDARPRTPSPNPSPTDTPDVEPTDTPAVESNTAPAPPKDPTIGDTVEGGGGAIIWPGFEVMPFVEHAAPGEAHIDFSKGDWSAKDHELYLTWTGLEVPEHDCAPITAWADNDELLAKTDEYANCLYDAWRPELQRFALPYEQQIVVSFNPKVDEDVDEHWYTALAWENKIDLDGSIVPDLPAPMLTKVMAHEVAHVVQSSIRHDDDMQEITMMSSWYDGEEEEGYVLQGRRHELQAECLAVAMLDVRDPMTFGEHVSTFSLNGSDRYHGDWASVEYWTNQGLHGSVRECNTAVAVPSLTRWDPDGGPLLPDDVWD